MRAIIIAAGMGSRLEHHTQERPKCMVEVGGRSILSYQLEAFRENGIEDIHIVRGYLADRLVVPGATYHHNAEFRTNNILLSLFCAEEAMEGELVTTYSDIVYTPEVVARAIASRHDVGLVVDRQWHLAYEGREDHPVDQAELVEAEGSRVVRVGKRVGPEQAVGEFIGLARYSAEGVRLMRETMAEVRQRQSLEEPFHYAAVLRKAYLTDLFMEMIARGHDVGPIPIDGQWREIDTVEDLERAGRIWATTPAGA